jgi:2-hydroxy-3-oxopropionate reductase
MARIAFIGLGTMGRHMAINLAKAGHEVRALDLRPEALEGIEALGPRPADGIADAVAGADLAITMLPDTPQVEEVVRHPGGLLDHPPAGKLLVEMSTISPAATRDMAAALAERGIAMLDAPVSGGPTGARDARLSIMVGGPAEAFARARPVLEAMGRTIVHVGDSGAGQAVKLCNQVICGINLMGIAEALALGRSMGLDPGKLREVLMGGSANSWMLENLGPLMIAKDPRAGFRIDLKLKDLRLAGEAAFEQGVPLPGTALVTSLYLEARAHGEGSNGNQALYKVYDRLANQEEEEKG